MDTKTPFDFPAYIARLTEENLLCQANHFKPTTCSGIEYLEEMLQNFQTTSHFIATSDVCDESLRQVGGGWMKRRLFTVFILARYTYGDQPSLRRALSLCREVYRQFLSRLLHEESALQGDLLFLNLADVRSQELGGTFLNGCTGLYFMLTMDEPTDITYQIDQWQAETNA